ncbi:MAG TPA: hydrolase [Gammaproteobacteria bacterium]|nr:hydrolase [Gammaproteobacteria bacterium]|tara:strand:+ start:4967 stop:5842 length:876 start_codon:yes stop_codon:yes gene_type:complete
MKLARFEYNSVIYFGLADPKEETLTGVALRPTNRDQMIELMQAQTDGRDLNLCGPYFDLADVKFLPPISEPSKNILCIGKNYVEHAKEFARSGFDSSAKSKEENPPEDPIIFSKAPCTMIGAYEHIRPPWDITSKVDYEGELGVVIGVGGRSISRESAYEHVWGYTIINDVTARDLQAVHMQWLLGKSIDTFCPIGPWIVSADELDPGDLDLKCWVNDELRQDANTGDLIFDIPAIIEAISASMSLFPGDIIATGTPAGVGIGYDPPRFLKPRDRVRVAISGIGEIENTVV